MWNRAAQSQVLVVLLSGLKLAWSHIAGFLQRGTKPLVLHFSGSIYLNPNFYWLNQSWIKAESHVLLAFCGLKPPFYWSNSPFFLLFTMVPFHRSRACARHWCFHRRGAGGGTRPGRANGSRSLRGSPGLLGSCRDTMWCPRSIAKLGFT